jgi:hypothetical protein
LASTVQISPTSLTWQSFQRVGTFDPNESKKVTVTNTGTADVTFTAIDSSTDFFGSTTCSTLAPGTSCTVTVSFYPNADGVRNSNLTFTDNAVGSPQTVSMSGTGISGYYIVGAHGETGWFGDATDHGDAYNPHPPAITTAIATTPDGEGYWLARSDGHVSHFGDSVDHGTVGTRLARPIVGMAATRNGGGYWLVGSDGGVFSFGNAKYFGSTGNLHLNKPIVAIAATADDRGYWLFAADGGVFSFGDARYHGSLGNLKLAKPINGAAAEPDGKGYWLFASDGGVFSFGSARYHGSGVSMHVTEPVVGGAATSDGKGYWMVTRSGRLLHFGDAPKLPDLPSLKIPTTDVVGMAPTTPPLDPEVFA